MKKNLVESQNTSIELKNSTKTTNSGNEKGNNGNFSQNPQIDDENISNHDNTNLHETGSSNTFGDVEEKRMIILSISM